MHNATDPKPEKDAATDDPTEPAQPRAPTPTIEARKAGEAAALPRRKRVVIEMGLLLSGTAWVAGGAGAW